MNILEIIKRKSGSKYQLAEVIHVVNDYIRQKRGVDVAINLEEGLPQRNHPLFATLYTEQLRKLYNAFDIASDYFIKKEDEKDI